MTASPWTDDHVGRLKTLWREGRTADQIARELAGGVTRSAVLGKVYRMGLSAGRAARPVSKSVLSTETKAVLPRRPVVSSRPPPTLQRGTPERGLTTVLLAKRCDCRWPFGDPQRSDFTLCGRPVARGAFCASHAAIAYRPRPDTSRTMKRLVRLG